MGKRLLSNFFLETLVPLGVTDPFSLAPTSGARFLGGLVPLVPLVPLVLLVCLVPLAPL